MDNIIKDGEQMVDGGGSNQQQGNDQSQQQSSSGNSGSSGGGFVSNTEDAYINQEANSFLSKEGVPTAVDGAIDGGLDTEVNKYKGDI